MNFRNHIHCTNQNCEADCGVDYAATNDDSGYIDLIDGAMIDERNGDVFCSQECYDACHLVYCADCGDEKVGKAGDRCTFCAIVSEKGEDAAEAWYYSQHPEFLRKPVASVPVAGAGGIVHKRVV